MRRALASLRGDPSSDRPEQVGQKVVALFAHIARGVHSALGRWPTLEHVMSIAFLADMSHFRQHGRSISGETWIKAPDGTGADWVCRADIGGLLLVRAWRGWPALPYGAALYMTPGLRRLRLPRRQEAVEDFKRRRGMGGTAIQGGSDA